jgi:hypothetical protein
LPLLNNEHFATTNALLNNKRFAKQQCFAQQQTLCSTTNALLNNK